eukprot:TRINITY_DN25338_c0_g1_i6.p1 TRINITY_DN25338_c0_g1~~TRINITY_DN25338_c0_g1_i6.p1  ORF type:complete len:237 (-),score=95.02 TRINITY_DN25338_c0_g1_i6:98-718(-)
MLRSLVGSEMCIRDSVWRELRRSELYWIMKRTVKHELLKSKYSASEVSAAIPAIMDRTHLQLKLQNTVYQIHRQAQHSPPGHALHPQLPVGESLEVVRSARSRWEQRVREEIESVAQEQNRPVQRLKQGLLEPGALGEEGYTTRFLFDEHDFLELLAKIPSPNKDPTAKLGNQHRIQLEFKTKSLAELRTTFKGCLLYTSPSPRDS